ncbi:hypothetical protein PoB_007527200 [Plakobranchus ocellatus]|uniref:Uncharacterized protein n=1 Tax=Plakobranchus ocellatus TaxID=259542 RepID=A0AAV4DWT3_9GAST|nr:hypothetical protein PoB_007527200 [Plakobranchus ocellatus]
MLISQWIFLELSGEEEMQEKEKKDNEEERKEEEEEEEERKEEEEGEKKKNIQRAYPNLANWKQNMICDKWFYFRL